MAKTTKNKFVIIDPSQKSEHSHNNQYNRIIAKSAVEAGFDVTLLTHAEDKSNFSDLGIMVSRIFPHSLYDYEATHDHWRSVFWRKAYTLRSKIEYHLVHFSRFGFFQRFPDVTRVFQFLLRALGVLLSPFIYLLDFLQARLVYKGRPYHRDLFAEIVAGYFATARISSGDQVVMHSSTFGALEGFLSIRALSSLKQPYPADFTAIFHHSLDEEQARRSWYVEYYQRTELRSLKRRWEIGSPFKASRFLALSPQLVTHLRERSSLPFALFNHIADKSLFSEVEADAARPEGSLLRIGLRASDISLANVDLLVGSIRKAKSSGCELKLCIFARGAFLNSREALNVASSAGDYELLDTTHPKAFFKALQSVDVCILPYEPIAYEHRISAVMYEATMLGVNLLVPEKTTMASETSDNIYRFGTEAGTSLGDKLIELGANIDTIRDAGKVAQRVNHVRDRLLRNSVQTDFVGDNNQIQTLPYAGVAVIVSPFWGRCGSTTVFDSETEYLLDCGYYTARSMVIQWRVLGNSTKYIYDTLRENSERVRPHVFLVSSPQRRHLIWLYLSSAFRKKSALGQDVMRLGSVTEHDPRLASYFMREADLVIVNHSFHGDYLKRFSKAKVVLETQDIQALQYAIRKETNRITKIPESIEAWTRDEAVVWRGVDACVNLSPDEQSTIRQHQPNSHMILPLIDQRQPSTVRSWAQYCADNHMHESVSKVDQFDFLLWGDSHPANVTSTRWFIEHFIVSGAIPNAKVLVVGRVGHAVYDHFAGSGSLYYSGSGQKYGYVDSLDDAILRSKVLVLPDQTGSGISIKTMETLAIRRPFIATPTALRSLNLGDGRYGGSATWQQLLTDAQLLLKSEKARKERVKVAKYLYDLNFSRDQYYQKWDKVLASVGISTDRAAH